MNPASQGQRIAATFIDGIAVMIVSAVLSIVPILGTIAGMIVGIAYLLLRDGLPIPALDNVSIGKKVMGLKVVDATTGQPINDMARSCQRNWMLAIPCLGIIFAIVEIVLMFNDAEGRRWGDKLANTKVVSVK